MCSKLTPVASATARRRASAPARVFSSSPPRRVGSVLMDAVLRFASLSPGRAAGCKGNRAPQLERGNASRGKTPSLIRHRSTAGSGRRALIKRCDGGVARNDDDRTAGVDDEALRRTPLDEPPALRFARRTNDQDVDVLRKRL